MRQRSKASLVGSSPLALLTFHCPETGEVHVIRKGDTLYFPPNTWHWGYNFGSETCHILESLTPRTEEAVEAYAVKTPWLKNIKHGPHELNGKFAPGGSRGKQRARLVRPGDYLYEIVGEKQPMRVGLVCSTDMLTTAIVDLYAGQESEQFSHPGDKVLFCLDGRMNVYLPSESPNWWEMSPGDARLHPGGLRPWLFQQLRRSREILVQRCTDIQMNSQVKRIERTRTWVKSGSHLRCACLLLHVAT